MKPDPRLYQIGTLASLLGYGLFRLDFDLPLLQAAAMLGTALLTQFACTRLWRLPAFDPRSALISGLSLCLLLRSNSSLLAIVAAIVTVGSKFVIRINGKHLFNPTNIGVVSMVLGTGLVWVSPGQWGNVAFFAFLMACLGGLVVNRAARSDVTLAFIGFYMALVFGRSLWLGEPMTIPLHRLQSGALLLFTFFMISDPRTTPNSRAGRILFALLVACGAWYVQFRMFRTNGLLWSLAFFSMTVPLIDLLLPGRRYEWSRPTTGRKAVRSEIPAPNEVTHETADSGNRARRGLRVVGSDAHRLLRFLRSQG
jgi:Na+-transporting NADH:ubiquinone oxidoreductase subunit NqrB